VVTARAFLVRGLLAGLLAGLGTFLVAHQVGEPPLSTAVALESGAHADEHADSHAHEHEESGISRGTQETWGLLTGSLAVGLALGGLVALGAAFAAGRLGRLGTTSSTAVVAATGFVAVAVVPWLKYPANPPGIGSAATIGARSADYFGFLLVSVVAAVAALVLASRAWPRLGSFRAVLLGAAGYAVVVIVVGALMPAIDEVGDFPADTLWAFRRASLLTLLALWAVLGVVLSGLVDRLAQREAAVARRRALAASL